MYLCIYVGMCMYVYMRMYICSQHHSRAAYMNLIIMMIFPNVLQTDRVIHEDRNRDRETEAETVIQRLTKVRAGLRNCQQILHQRLCFFPSIIRISSMKRGHPTKYVKTRFIFN